MPIESLDEGMRIRCVFLNPMNENVEINNTQREVLQRGHNGLAIDLQISLGFYKFLT